MRNSLGLFAAGLAGMVCWYAPGWWSVPGWVAGVLGAAAAFLAGYWVASPRWATVLIMMLPGLYVPIPHIFAPVYLLWSVDGPQSLLLAIFILVFGFGPPAYLCHMMVEAGWLTARRR